MKPIRVEGLIDQDVAALFIEQLYVLEGAKTSIRVDLSEADIEDAKVVVRLVETFRKTAQRVKSLEVYGAPQNLAHSLYRIGALGDDSPLRLVEPREEIGTSS